MIRSHADRLRSHVLLLVGILAPLSCADPVFSQAVRTDVMATDGVVRSSALVGKVLYLGGDFTWVGFSTGPAALVGAASGTLIPGFPRVPDFENVNAVIPDGSGGWFLAGSFTQIGGVPRQNLAHVLANNTVAPWTPNPDGEVLSILLRGSTLIVGGSFTSIGGQLRNNLAAVSTSGAGLATTWNPDLDGGVETLAGSPSTIYAGGSFTTVGGLLHFGLTAIDATSGAPSATWSPQVFGFVSALALSDTTLYVGGILSAISGAQSYSNLAAVGAVTGAVHAWGPSPDGIVTDLSVPPSGDPVYVAGDFQNIGGQLRSGLAAISRTTGTAILNWNPNPDAPVARVLWSGKTIYAGGSFARIGSATRFRVAALDSANGKASGWAPNANGDIIAIAASGGSVLLGGGGLTTSIGGVPRNRAAAIDLNTGRALSWNPDVDGTVGALAVQGSTVYMGGTFATVGGVARPFAAAVDIQSGAVRGGWSANADGEVLSIAAGTSSTYFGGTFTSIGGAARNVLAALDTTTGLATTWNPNPAPLGGSIVTALVTSGSTVFVGGGFSSIGGQPRTSLAAIGANGLATTWVADVGGVVNALALSGSTLYLGGSFSLINSQVRSNLGAVGAVTGTVAAFAPAPTGPVLALAAAGDTIYAGGFFANIGGASRASVAALNAAGTATPWNVGTNGAVYSLAATRALVCIGGDFTTAGSVLQSHFAVAGAGTVATGVDDALRPPLGPQVQSVEPNPFSRSAWIRFALPAASRVTLDVLDVTGRRVSTLMEDAAISAGEHQVSVRGAGLKPGIYLVRLRAGGRSHTAKLVHVE